MREVEGPRRCLLAGALLGLSATNYEGNQKTQALSGAPHKFIARYSAWWRAVEEPVSSVAEGTLRVLILSTLFGAFRPPRPENRQLIRRSIPFAQPELTAESAL